MIANFSENPSHVNSIASYQVPTLYQASLYNAFFVAGTEKEQRILQTRFETSVLPLSKLFRKIFTQIREPNIGTVQVVHLGCGSKGADEVWAANLAGQEDDPAQSLVVSSIGLDPDEAAMEESRGQVANLLALGLIDSANVQLITADAGQIRFVDTLPHIPLVAFLRYPEHREGRESDGKGFDYSHVFAVWAQAIKEFAELGIPAIFIVSDPPMARSGDYKTTLRHMESIRMAIDPAGTLEIQQTENPFPSRYALKRDGLLTILAPKSKFNTSALSS